MITNSIKKKDFVDIIVFDRHIVKYFKTILISPPPKKKCVNHSYMINKYNKSCSNYPQSAMKIKANSEIICSIIHYIGSTDLHSQS